MQLYEHLEVGIKSKLMLGGIISIHDPHFLVFPDTLFKEICLSFQGYVFHKVKRVLDIVNLKNTSKN